MQLQHLTNHPHWWRSFPSEQELPVWEVTGSYSLLSKQGLMRDRQLKTAHGISTVNIFLWILNCHFRSVPPDGVKDLNIEFAQVKRVHEHHKFRAPTVEQPKAAKSPYCEKMSPWELWCPSFNPSSPYASYCFLFSSSDRTWQRDASRQDIHPQLSRVI